MGPVSALGLAKLPTHDDPALPCEERPAVSVVIITHDSRLFIETCLRAVLASRFSAGMEVVVVDNASTDGTPDAVRRGFPEVRMVRPETRGGFARNANLGIEASHGCYVMLLNPDTALEPDALEVLWQSLEDSPEAAAIGPLLEGSDGVRESSARRFPSLARTLVQSLMLDRLPIPLPGLGSDLGRDAARDRRVDWVSGACLMVRREAIDGNDRHRPAGPLDDRMFLFVEDTEWCWRLHASGWDVLYTPRARVLHHKGSGHGFSPWRYALNCRGHAYFFRKHHGAVAAWIYQVLLLPGLVLRTGLAGLALLIGRHDRAELVRRVRGYLSLARRVASGGLERDGEVT